MRSIHKPKWRERRVAAPGPHLTLVRSQEEFDRELQRLAIATGAPYLSTTHCNATTHVMDNTKGELCCIVGLGDVRGRSPVEVAGLLVHEAVHVWQTYAQRIGETNPGIEQEAYAIQAIAQELMAEYARRMGCDYT